MGTDFLKKTAKTFKREMSNGLDAMSQPDLWVLNPELKPRKYVLHPYGKNELTPGAEYLARVDGNKVIANRDNTPVGEVRNVSKHELRALQELGGYGTLHVLKTLPVSGAADVTLR